MHLLYGALPVPYVPVRDALSALDPHRYTYALPCCRTSQYRRTFIPISVSLWIDHANPEFDGVGLESFKSKVYVFFISLSYSILFCLLLYFPSLVSVYGLVLWGWGLWTDRV